MELHKARMWTALAVCAVLGTAGTAAAAPAPLPPRTVTRLAQGGPTGPVIVLLRDQHPGTPIGARRAEAIHADQQQLVAQARQAGATHITQYSLINGFAATVTSAERSRLAGSPQVQAVVPDLPVRLDSMPTVPVGHAMHVTAHVVAPRTGPTACGDAKTPLTEPEALAATHDVQAQQLATGKGVTIAFLADGADIDNPDFVRADGSHVFTDYRDFTGEGLDVSGDDREAFGDASAIGAQGRQTYDLSQFVNAANPLPQHCDIRILGMAPDASLVGLKVIAANGFGSTSAVVQAIDYAVDVDHVNVLSESLGSNPYPDNGTDPFTLADDAAVAAGVTVVNSAGDSGYAGTVDNPSSDPQVISVGASTTFRTMAQTWDTLPGMAGTWENDNVSAISSGGITQRGRVEDLMAPGDLGWALCSTNINVYLGCTNFQGKPSPIQAFGGTSQAAPLVAGAAALVIQAYTQTHNGVAPTPALVHRILTSTAVDTGAPADRQGSGLLDALAAVQAANSISDAHGSPYAQGNGLLLGQSQLDATGAPGTAEHFSLNVTNVGADPQTIAAHGRQLSRVLSDLRGSVQLDTTAPSNMNSRGGTADNYVTKTFTVAPGADHLDASIAWSDPTGPANTLVLLDPHGAFAGYSMPQADNGPDYGHVDVRAPLPGTWTALIYGEHSPIGFVGQVDYDFTTTAYGNLGTVSAPLTLDPGQTGAFRIDMTTPSRPGDLAAAVQLDSGTARLAVPVVLRSLVPTTGSGAFAGVLTGGNGRPGAPAQSNTYGFDVSPGQHDLDVDLALEGSVDQGVVGYLVSPDGQIVSQATNVLAVNDNGFPTEYGRSLQNYKRAPLPGRWTYVVAFQNPVSGATTSEPFSGHVVFNRVDVTSTGLPAGDVLPAGKPVNVTVKVHNTSTAEGLYFVDARTSKWTDAQLIPNGQASDVPLAPSASLGYLVPPDTSRVTGVTSGTVPVSADLFTNAGEPERLAPPGPGNVAVVSDWSPAISQGLWLLEADPIGPFGTTHTTGTVNFAAVAHTQSFDDAVTSSTGDHWLAAVQAKPPAFVPVTVDPGNTGTITVTMRPDAPKGTTVTGWLYVDDSTLSDNAGDELIALPYSYTVG